MWPLTAVAFLLCSIALACEHWCFVHPDRSINRLLRQLSCASSALVLSIGITISAEYLMRVDAGVDDLLFPRALRVAGGSHPGRMALGSALGFVLLGTALLWLDWPGRGTVSPLLASIVSSIGLLALQGYLFDVSALYEIFTFDAIAINTAFLFVITGIGTMLVRPDIGWMRQVTSRFTGGKMLRRVLPIVVVAPILIAWLRWIGEQAGLYGESFGLALFCTSVIFLLSITVWLTAKSINDADQARAKVVFELRESEERFRLALRAASMGSWIFDRISNTVEWDAKCRDIFGVDSDTVITPDLARSLVHPDDRQQLRESGELAANPDKDGRYYADFRIIRQSDGALRYVHSFGEYLFDTVEGVRTPVRLIGTIQDISAAKQVHETLVRTNDDLRQFAYAAAHDLQEPLRNVALALGLLKRHEQDKLKRESLELIDEAVGGAKRLHRMVKDLLTFTRVTEDEADREFVGVESVTLDVLRDLQILIEQNHASVRVVTKLPEVRMAETHLRQLLQNLISNALKYRSPDRQPKVEISAALAEAEWQFTVADNGIGFDPEHSKQIFGIFKRLHTYDTYPGSGIGLAVCARIVSSYGGRIWATSHPGEGSRFTFSIPAERRTVGVK